MVERKEHTTARHLLKGAEFDLCIEKMAFGGQALGKVDGFVVFVDHALPGQKVRAQITRRQARFAEAKVVRVLEQSQAYQAPFCPHFGICGGCQWQDLAYEQQLYWKWIQVQECLKHLGGLSPGVILPTIPSPQQRYYRNKMEFTFAPRSRAWLRPEDRTGAESGQGRGCALGLHLRDSSDRIFDLENCFLQSAQAPAIVEEVRRWCGASGLPAYDPETRRGYWRYLVLREGKRTAQTLVQIITSHQDDPNLVEGLAYHLRDRFPGLTTFVHSRSRKKARLADWEVSQTLWGPGYIEEQLGELRLRVSVQSFLQANTLAAESLYSAVRRLGDFTGRETVWDLYCGAGSIGLSLASRVRQVVGFELVAEAVTDAWFNSRLNGLSNCQFLAGDLKESIQETLRDASQPRPNMVIADPPRGGLHPEVVKALKELSPRRLIYVSCNPATLARDLSHLKDQYEALTLQPFDFFPHTPHIECVVCLERRPRVRS